MVPQHEKQKTFFCGKPQFQNSKVFVFIAIITDGRVKFTKKYIC